MATKQGIEFDRIINAPVPGLCTTLPWRMLLNWLWISRCGDYWQQAELRTDVACWIMMMMMITNALTN